MEEKYELDNTEQRAFNKEQEQQKIEREEDKAYATDSIVDYSKNFIHEKRMSSQKKESTNYSVETDQLDSSDEKQPEEVKVSAQKVNQRLAKPQPKPESKPSKVDEKKDLKQEVTQKVDAEIEKKKALEKAHKEAQVAAQKKVQE